MKNNIIIYLAAFSALLFAACSDQTNEPEIDFCNDVSFNQEEKSLDIAVPSLDFVIPDSPFTARAYRSGSVVFNVKKNADGSHTGFALSNKNYRSYPWCNSYPHGSENVSDEILKSATDTALFSVYTGSTPNQLKNFAVCRVENEDAYFTLDKPRIVEHILVANNTFNFLTLNYGGTYGTKTSKKANPNIPNTVSSLYGAWTMPDYYNFGEGEAYTTLPAKGYLKLIATGYNNNTITGTSEYYIAVKTGGAPEPYDKWNIIQSFWAAWDLSTLGMVDKVVFTMDGSVKTKSGKLKAAPYFCIDGIRLSE